MFVLAMLLQAATPVAPPAATARPVTPPVTPQGAEMVDLFGGMCVETALSSAKAHALDSQPAIARAMTADELSRTAPGNSAQEGWIVQSPHDAWGALWFAPTRRTCGVTVRAADPVGMQAALDRRLLTFYGALGFMVMHRPDETLMEGGATVHRASWSITAGRHELSVIASFADRPIGGHQHLMTFSMLR